MVKQNIKHLFIINPKSFWKKSKQNQVVAKIHEFFREKANGEYEIYVSRFPRDAVGFIPIYAETLPDSTTLRVYAVGGDGILYDCLNGIMRVQHAELASIPYGYTNSFMQGLDRNFRTLFRSFAQQYDAPTIPIDVMRCGCNYALSYCSIGLEAEGLRRAVRVRESLMKGHAFSQWLCRRLYVFSYFLGLIGASSNKKLMQQKYSIKINKEEIDDVFQGISIFNSPYFGGILRPVSNAMPNDGILDMLTIKSSSALKTLCMFPFYETGNYKLFPRNFNLRRGEKVAVRSDDVFKVALDGTVFYESELDIELFPAAVQFVDAGKHGYKGGRS